MVFKFLEKTQQVGKGDPPQLAILLVTARKHPEQWIIPRGTVEVGETYEAAALREAYEEGGVLCDPSSVSKITSLSPKQGQNAEVFTMLCTEILSPSLWPEATQRQRQWVSIPKAQLLLRQAVTQVDFRAQISELLGTAWVSTACYPRKTIEDGAQQKANGLGLEMRGNL